MGRGGRKYRKSSNDKERQMASALDNLAKYEEFKEEVLPKIRKMLTEGKTTQEILEFGKAYAAARMVTEAITNPDAGKALTAAKDILDRTEGKAKESIDIKHKYEQMKDEELDALLSSRLQEVSELDTPDKQEH